MKKLPALLLIAAGIAFCYLGVYNFQESAFAASFLGFDIEASDGADRAAGILYTVIGVGAIFGGIVLFRKK